MKKSTLLFTFATVTFITRLTFGQPCIPNNDTISGIEPDTLATAYVGMPYEQIIYFRLPEDTLVDFVIGTDTITILVCIDSLTIDSVHGLPDGFVIGCNVPWCSVLGGGNGCASITGTATADQVGIHPLDVFVTIYINDCFSFALPPMVDTISFYFLDIQFPLGGENISAPQEFLTGNLYPNPANDILFIPLNSNLNKLELTILDMAGKEIENKTVFPGNNSNTLSLDISNLQDGAYLMRIRESGGVLLRKFYVIR